MSKETACTKGIQPCIMSMLSPSAELMELSAAKSDPIEAPFQSVKSKKRKRSCKSREHTEINPNKKPVTKTPDKMSVPVPSPTSKDTIKDNNPDGVKEGSVELSPELKELEKRLNTSMLININRCITEALQPIKDSIDKIVNSSVQIDHHDNEIKHLNVENSVLETQVSELWNDMDSIKLRTKPIIKQVSGMQLNFQGC